MKNLKMSTKLLTGYAIVIALTITVGVVGIIGLHAIDDSYSQSYINTALPLPILAQAIEDLTDTSVNIRNAIIYMNDPIDFQEAITSATESLADFESSIGIYDGMINNSFSREAYDAAWELYQENYRPAVQRIMMLTQDGNQDKAIEALNTMREARLAMSDYMLTCLRHDSMEGEINSKKNTDLSNMFAVLLVTVVILAVVASVVTALYLSNIISKPIIFAKIILSRIGHAGDLEFSDSEYIQASQYAAYRDEIGQSVGMLLTTVRRLVKIGQALEKVAAGNLTGELSLLSDKDIMGISLQKMTDNLNDMFDELEQQATALREARDLAISNSYYKSEFLSRMSHEIRTPMNAVIGMTNLAMASNSIERKDYCLNKIDSASKHLLGVINDVLDMSKIEAGKFDLSFTDFNLERMLIKISNVVNFRIEEKGQTFYIQVDPDVPPAIVSDEQRLSQIITNLLGNANKFTPEHGSVSLLVRKLEEEDGFCMLEFEVKDTGIGISEEQQQKLFRPFEQADGTISRRFGGTGLGLAISKHIVTMLGGNIRVVSEHEKGSSFIFTIRAEIGQEISRPLPVDGINWDNLRVMAVDDEDNIREFFTHIADSYGIRCDVAACGSEALELIGREGPFNIAFVDWKMPEMDGINLTKKIKEQYGTDTIIIMISAMEWSSIETEARQAGVSGFISKPLFGSLIVDCINEYIGPRQQAKAAFFEGGFTGKRILLAEDVEINREIIISMLEHTGIQIDCAEDGGVAYRMFKDNPDYDLIFMDVHMPEVNGYEATNMIRRLDCPQAKTVPIIAMTASVFKEDIDKCLASGMNSHIGKPLEFESVLETMKQYLT